MCQVIMLYVSGRLACRIGSLMLTESGVEILALVQPFVRFFIYSIPISRFKVAVHVCICMHSACCLPISSVRLKDCCKLYNLIFLRGDKL